CRTANYRIQLAASVAEQARSASLLAEAKNTLARRFGFPNRACGFEFSQKIIMDEPTKSSDSLPHNLRLQLEAVEKAFLRFAENHYQWVSAAIRSDYQKILEEKQANIQQLNVEYWQAMNETESRLTEIREFVAASN